MSEFYSQRDEYKGHQYRRHHKRLPYYHYNPAKYVKFVIEEGLSEYYDTLEDLLND